MKASHLSLLALCSLALYADPSDDHPPLFTYYTVDSSGSKEAECTSQFRQSKVGIRTDQVRGIGYKRGYTTLESFTIFGDTNHWMPCLDVRGHVFNDGKLAGNLGIGGRKYLSSLAHTFGAFLYYDVRQHRHFTMNQLSPGFEMVGKRMEYRLNAYFPVGRTHHASHHTEFAHFRGNKIVLKRHEYRSLLGVDAEVGGHWTKGLTYDLYTAVGPYYLTAMHHHKSQHGASWGGMVRVLGRYKDIVSLQAKYSYDSLFKNTIQGEVGFHYAFGKKLKGRRCNNQCDPVISRATFAPYRLEIPMAKRMHRHEVAINPDTQQPWKVWFVDNTSNSLGTYESPFPKLVDAENVSNPSDIIYVFPGDQTTQGMDQGITLQDGQQLLGSGVSHSLTTTHGLITIPALTQGTYPTLTASGNVVILAHDNTVSGMQLNVPLGRIGITAPILIRNSTITSNTIFGPSAHSGVNFTCEGNVIVSDNQLTNSGASGFAISIQNGANVSANLVISNNKINGYQQGVRFNITPNTFSNCSIVDNYIADFAEIGIRLFPEGLSGSTAIVSNNFIGMTGNIGILVRVQHPSSEAGTVTMTNNAIDMVSTLQGDGILYQMVVPYQMKTALHGNSINVVQTAAGSDGIDFVISSGEIDADFLNNTVSINNATQSGLKMTATGNGEIDIARFKGNTFPRIQSSGNVNMVYP